MSCPSPQSAVEPTAPSHAQPSDGTAVASASICVIEGIAAILAHSPALEEFARTTGQHAAAHGLHFTLNHKFARQKVPYLVCLLAHPHDGGPISPDTLLGCVLFFEYRLGLWKSGFVATGDVSGIRSVLAPAALRSHIAARASAEMLRRAQIVLATFRQEEHPARPEIAVQARRSLWASRVREVRDRMTVGPTADATLATLGKRTRTHLRYYRKRVQDELGCEFVPCAHRHITPRDLPALNTASLNPIAHDAFDLQYRTAAELPGGFVCGLRAADGRWLSLAGGWRQETTSIVQWQANAAGFEKLSLGTAFRAFLLEHEVSLGTTRLCFHNGTSHSMHHAFPPDQVVDLLLRRSTLKAWLALRLLPAVARSAQTLKGNILAKALDTNDLEWRPLPHPPKRVIHRLLPLQLRLLWPAVILIKSKNPHFPVAVAVACSTLSS